jgi:hypothetical protein
VVQKLTYQGRVCRTKPVRHWFRTTADACRSILVAEARAARDPGDAGAPAAARSEARDRFDAVLSLYEPLGCRREGMAEAFFTLVDAVVDDVVP